MLRFLAPLIILMSLLLSLPGFAQKGFEVKKVEFEGNNAFRDSRLKKLMISSPQAFPLSIFISSEFIPDLFEDDLKNLTEFYHNEGYLQASVVDTQIVVNAKKKQVSIKLTIEEGELTRVEGISFFGNAVFDDSLLLRRTKLKIGGPFKRPQVNEAELSILTLYANHGYLEAEIETGVRTSEETYRAVIDFSIRERQQFSVADIQVKGLEKTKKKIVSRELLFKPGEVIKYSKLLESQRALYLTGLFESVFIRPIASSEPGKSPRDSSLKNILVELKEKDYGEFNVSLGFGTLDKVRGRAEIFYTNLAGTGRKVGFGVHASFIRRYVEASFTEPRTFGLPWRTDMNAFLEYREDPGFDLSSTGGKITIGRNLSRFTRASLSYRYENATIENVKVSPLPKDVKANIRSLILSFVYDSRNNLFDPTRGLYFEWKNELAGGFLSGSNAFMRSSAEAKYFHPLGRLAVIASAIEFGWIDQLFADSEIPLNEKFYAGGPESLRAFGYQKVGPLDAKRVPLGGNFQLVLNAVELRQTIYKWFGVVSFLDVGNVWPETRKFVPSEMRFSPGIGIRLSTPIGLARVDYGINVDRRPGESRGTIYFSMGQAF